MDYRPIDNPGTNTARRSRISPSNTESWGIFYFVIALIAAIAITALVVAAIALADFNNNKPPSKWQLDHPSGKMQLPTNYTMPENFTCNTPMQLTGFDLVFGNGVALGGSPGTALIPQSHSGTWHFDLQVLMLGQTVGPATLTRNFQAWLTVDGISYKNGGWAQDDSVSHTFAFTRPNKYLFIVM